MATDALPQRYWNKQPIPQARCIKSFCGERNGRTFHVKRGALTSLEDPIVKRYSRFWRPA
jgi:hypothetical protein